MASVPITVIEPQFEFRPLGTDKLPLEFGSDGLVVA
jgi:hypothetical protein